MKFIVAIYTCLLLTASLLDSAFAQHVITGADGEKVTIQDTSRIITMGSAITETVFALGAGGNISTSYYQARFQMSCSHCQTSSNRLSFDHCST